MRRGEGHSSGMIKGREKGAVYPNAQFSAANPNQEVQYSIRRRGDVLVQNGGGHARTETEMLGLHRYPVRRDASRMSNEITSRCYPRSVSGLTSKGGARKGTGV